MSNRDINFNQEKYALELIKLVFNSHKEPERKSFYIVMIDALKLAYKAGDWGWYEDLYKRTERRGMGQYKKFLIKKAMEVNKKCISK